MGARRSEQASQLFPVTKPRVLLGLALADVQAAGRDTGGWSPSGQGGGRVNWPPGCPCLLPLLDPDSHPF